MRKELILALLVLSFGTVLAQNRVILVTDKNIPDLYAAIAAGSHEGTPVLSLINGQLDDNVTAIIADYNATEVVLVGGTRVISDDIESQLESMGYNVTRLWGFERTKTAIQVAKYFWTHANCTVLVEDTNDPENDSLVEEQASNIANLNDCPVIPLPGDDIPSEVLEALNSLNVTSISYVARQLRTGVRDELKEFNITELIGNLTQIREKVRERVLNKTKPGMTIVASHGWNGTLGIGAELNNNTLIRRVNNMTQMPDVLSFIQQGNISPIKVVGEIVLAGQIVDYLQANNVSPIKYTGKPAELIRQLFNETKQKFIERKETRALIRLSEVSSRIQNIRSQINDTLSQLDDADTEIENLKSQGVDTTDLENELNDSRELVNDSEGNVTTNQDLAERLLAKALSNLQKKLANQALYNWTDKLNDENDNSTGIMNRLRIAALQENITVYNNACNNTQAIQDLVNKAQELKNTALNETDTEKQAELLNEAKDIADKARNLGNVCIRSKSLPARLTNAIATSIARTIAKQDEITGRGILRNSKH